MKQINSESSKAENNNKGIPSQAKLLRIKSSNKKSKTAVGPVQVGHATNLETELTIYFSYARIQDTLPVVYSD